MLTLIVFVGASQKRLSTYIWSMWMAAKLHHPLLSPPAQYLRGREVKPGSSLLNSGHLCFNSVGGFWGFCTKSCSCPYLRASVADLSWKGRELWALGSSHPQSQLSKALPRIRNQRRSSHPGWISVWGKSLVWTRYSFSTTSWRGRQFVCFHLEETWPGMESNIPSVILQVST